MKARKARAADLPVCRGEGRARGQGPCRSAAAAAAGRSCRVWDRGRAFSICICIARLASCYVRNQRGTARLKRRLLVRAAQPATPCGLSAWRSRSSATLDCACVGLHGKPPRLPPPPPRTQALWRQPPTLELAAAGMLPTYRGADEESGRGEGPLLAARRARANGGSSQPAVGLILLTAACCGMLLFQVRSLDSCRVCGRCIDPANMLRLQRSC